MGQDDSDSVIRVKHCVLPAVMHAHDQLQSAQAGECRPTTNVSGSYYQYHICTSECFPATSAKCWQPACKAHPAAPTVFTAPFWLHQKGCTKGDTARHRGFFLQDVFNVFFHSEGVNLQLTVLPRNLCVVFWAFNAC